MVIRNVTLVFCMAATMLGCTHLVVLNPEGKRVSIVNERPKECTDLGEVYGKSNADDIEEAMHGARSDLKNHAAEKGASHVLLVTNNSRPVMGNWSAGVEILLGGQGLQCPTL